MLLSGQRTNGLLYGAVLYLIPLLSARADHVHLKVRTRWLWIIPAALTTALSIGYIDIQNRGITQLAGGATAGFLYRIFVIQGGVYFTADYRVFVDGLNASSSILFGNMSETIRTLAVPSLWDTYILRDVNLAGALPGNLALVFGFWQALPLLFLYGLVIGSVCVLLTFSVRSLPLAALLPGSYILVWLNTVYTQGSVNELLSPKLFIVSFAWLMIGVAGSRPGSSAGASVKVEAASRRQGVTIDYE
jgi:hypothetical protein